MDRGHRERASASSGQKQPALAWDELLKGEPFITATLHASQTALKSHQKEKPRSAEKTAS